MNINKFTLQFINIAIDIGLPQELWVRFAINESWPSIVCKTHNADE